MLEGEPGVIAYERGDKLVAINAGDAPAAVPAGEVVLATSAGAAQGRKLAPGDGVLVASSACIVQCRNPAVSGREPGEESMGKVAITIGVALAGHIPGQRLR